MSVRTATCACGGVVLEMTGPPIVTATCYCTSCRTAGQRLATLPGAAPIVEADGGTEYLVCRKDRMRCLQGAGALRAHRLTPASRTRRVVASCCNTAMFAEFTSGHWLSLYRRRFPAEQRPPVAMRVMTGDRLPGVEFADTLPSHAAQSGSFMWRLLLAWAAMGFRRPRIDYVTGTIEVPPQG